jgi:hypothetical protein
MLRPLSRSALCSQGNSACNHRGVERNIRVLCLTVTVVETLQCLCQACVLAL